MIPKMISQNNNTSLFSLQDISNIRLPSNTLKPFIRYYGGKYRIAPRYPKPLHKTIIEPFAGAAGYSLRYYYLDVILVEKYDVLACLWDYLIRVKPEEIRQIPLVEHIDDLPLTLPEGARYLVGFSFNDATTSPSKSLSSGRKRLAAMGRKYEGWNKAKRERIASQVEKIKHWKMIYDNYTSAPDIEATFFIDPPYMSQGKFYKHSSINIDYDDLAVWCLGRSGQIIVCENVGAKWLPFEPFIEGKKGSYRKVTVEEAIFEISL